jgi:hypothetical protein
VRATSEFQFRSESVNGKSGSVRMEPITIGHHGGASFDLNKDEYRKEEGKKKKEEEQALAAKKGRSKN